MVHVCCSAERDGRYLAVHKAAESTSGSPMFSILSHFLSVLHERMLPENTKHELLMSIYICVHNYKPVYICKSSIALPTMARLQL